MNEIIKLEVLNSSISLEEIDKNIKLYETDCVFIGGSIIEGQYYKNSKGMGNIFSDLDVFIIRNDEEYYNTASTFNSNFCKTDFYYINGINIDVEIYSRIIFEKIIEEISNAEINSNQRILNTLNLPNGINIEMANEILNRFYYSKCIKGNEQYNLYYENMNFKKFMIIYKENILNFIDNIIDDIQGNLERGQYDVALFLTREAFIEFLNFIIYENNEFVDRKKWIVLKFLNLSKEMEYTDVVEIYEKLFLENLMNNESKRKICIESMDFIRFRINNLVLEGSDLI